MIEITLKDIAEVFSKFNWGYSSSSNINEWKEGENAKRKIKEMVQTYLSQNPSHSNKILKLSNKIQEMKFSVLPFNSKIWIDKNFNQISMNESMLKESGILYRAGVKKYGKEGMKKIQQAAGKKKSHAEIGAIKDKYDKTRKEGKLTEGQEPFWTDKDSVIDAIKQIKKGLKNAVPYLDGISYSTLGGEPNIVGKISLDKKKDWTNGILENSRWALIYLSPDGVLDTIRMNGYSDFKTRKKVPILRKSKNKNLKQAIDRMGRYFTVVRTKHPDTK